MKHIINSIITIIIGVSITLLISNYRVNRIKSITEDGIRLAYDFGYTNGQYAILSHSKDDTLTYDMLDSIYVVDSVVFNCSLDSVFK